jgi:hypothetical protein
VSRKGNKATKDAVLEAADGLDDLLRRAEAGDRAVLPHLKDILATPGVTDLLGNLALRLQETVMTGLCGKNLAYREGVAQKMADMRAELAGPEPTPLERQLAERIVLCWLVLYESELRFAHLKDLPPRQADSWQRRIDGCHKRYVSAIKALATVRKLAVPILIGQVNVAARQVNKVTGPPAAAGAVGRPPKSDRPPTPESVT